MGKGMRDVSKMARERDHGSGWGKGNERSMEVDGEKEMREVL